MREHEVTKVETDFLVEVQRAQAAQASLERALDAEPVSQTFDEAPAPTERSRERPSPEQCDAVWLAIQEAILERIQPEQFETWFRRMALVDLDDSEIRLAVQNNFSRDWLNSYYGDVVEDAVTRVCGTQRKIVLTVDPELTIPAATHSASEESESPQPAGPKTSIPSASTLQAEQQLALPKEPALVTPSQPNEFAPNGLLWDSDIGLNEKYTFDNFVVGPCNRFAHAAAVGAAEAPGKAYNPFFLHGNVGLGKTHLLQSMYDRYQATEGKMSPMLRITGDWLCHEIWDEVHVTL